MKKKLRQIFLMWLAALLLLGTVPFTAFADEEDEEVPKVFHKDDDNDPVRLVIGKTPSVTIGKSSTISVTIKNTSDVDWVESEIWIAPESDYREYYDEVEDEDGELIKTMKATYPFEVTDSLNQHYKAGHIKAGAKKTINLKVNVKKKPGAGILSCSPLHIKTRQRRGRLIR